MQSTNTKLLSRVRSFLERGERIVANDCRDLFEIKDITALAKLARVPHERRFGRRAWYRNAWIAEYAGEDPGMFVAELDTLAPAVVAGLVIRCRWNRSESLATWAGRLRGFAASRMQASVALSPGFIVRLAAFEGVPVAAVLQTLNAAVPVIVTGEEAEVFDEHLRADHAPGVISVDEWIGVHRAAHGLGMKTIAAMTYGTIDHPAEYAAHLDAIRSLQDETGGFAAFMPMAVHNRDVGEFYLAAPTAAQTLRAVSIARIFLDNIQHIAVSPALVTLEVAVIALSYGANMIDTAIAVDDLHFTEFEGTPGATLTVIDPAAVEEDAGFAAASAERVRDRIAEARWTPVACSATFTEQALAAAR